MSQYSRQDVLRILDLQPRQLAAWEQAKLIPTQSTYSFKDLHGIRALRDLQATRMELVEDVAEIEEGEGVFGVGDGGSAVHGFGGAEVALGVVDGPEIDAGRGVVRVAGEDLMVEGDGFFTVVRRGSRLAFRHAGALVDPITRQLAFDFDLTHRSRQLRVLRTDHSSTALALELQELFHRAVRLEEDSTKREEAVALYHQVLARDPNHAPACINLGTIHYTQRDFSTAEAMYRRATVADPEYALAFFDLGNVLDELQQLPEAIEAYERAVALVPAYADAHYNLALAYERKGERRRALRHWQTYTRLDPTGPWSSHAREQARKILSTERLTLVTRPAV